MSDDIAQLDAVTEELERVIDDDEIPRNIRESLEEALERLEDDDAEPSERAAITMNVLNDVSNDPNLPMHTRTKLWNISGELETVTME